MGMFRRKADRIIDHAHSAIADAEAMLMHSFTDAHIAAANDELAAAQRYLSRAIAARDAWDSVDHDEYEDYPDVPQTEQGVLL